MSQSGKEGWGTRLGVIMAVMGSAVGLGNFLRFPGLAAQYEGAAFMIPYFIALLVLGLPLAWGEWAMGRLGGARGYNSTPGIFRVLWKSPLAPYFGVLGCLIPVGIYMYYILIESWCLGYAWHYLSGTMTTVGQQAALAGGKLDKAPYEQLFTAFTGATANGAALTGPCLIFLIICIAANFFLIYRGLHKGIEKFCLFAMPALVLCAILVLVRVLTLPNITEGLGFMWNPRGAPDTPVPEGFLHALMNPKMWMDATGQIFFSLSVGFGVIITYASYLKKDDDVALSSLTSVAGNEFCEVALGGMITIPAAFLFFGAAAVGSSFSLGFLTLPMVFESMPLGHIAGFLFFMLLFLAAITSSLSMLQPAIALMEEGLGLKRKTSVALLSLITLLGTAFIMYFSKNTLALGTFDFWVGTFCIFLLALFQVFLFGWVLGPERGMKELDRGAEIRVPRAVGFLLKWVAPVYLVAIFIAFVVEQALAKRADNAFAQIIDNPVVTMSIGLIGLVILFFLFVIHYSVKRWKALELQRGPLSREEIP